MVGIMSLLIEVAGFKNLGFPTLAQAIHIIPLSFFQVFQQILSSIAISRIPVSLSHTIKATSPVITCLIYAVFFNVSYSNRVYASLVPLTFGVMLLSHSSFVFDAVGILCAISSTVIFVLYNLASKKAFNQAASQHSKYKMDKLNMLFLSAIQAWILMAPVWLWTEGHKFPIDKLSFKIIGLFLLNGLSNFLQSLSSFLILSYVSPISYSIASLFKRIFVILFSILYIGGAIDNEKIVGVVLTLVGLYMYDQTKKEISKGEYKIAAMQELEAETLPTHKKNETIKFSIAQN